MPRIYEYDEYGTTEVLHTVERPSPPLDTGELRLQVKAVGLNPFDMKVRKGMVPLPDPQFPRTICSDLAGVVVEAAPDAVYYDGTPAAVGDEVLGWTEGSSLAEEAVLAATHVCRKPQDLSWESAGSLMTAALTADAALKVLNPGEGDTVLVSAAAGGVGLVYSQLALRAGARVIGTASESNHEFLRSLGVIPVTYGPGLAERVRALGTVTAVQDNFGRETIDAGLELGLPASRICSIVDHAAVAELGLASPGRYARSAATLSQLAELLASGELVLPIERAFGFDEVRAAFDLLESRHLRGKIVVTVP